MPEGHIYASKVAIHLSLLYLIRKQLVLIPECHRLELVYPFPLCEMTPCCCYCFYSEGVGGWKVLL